jgi:hypothetical protein
VFTQKHALAIAKKLECSMKEGKAHTYARLFDSRGLLITSFGIRRASKERGHGHLPSELHLTQKQAWELHDCSMTKEAYLQALREKNLLTESAAPKAEKEPETGKH